MAETLDLTTPITPTRPTITGYKVWSLYLGRGEGIIRIVVEDNNGERTTHVYADAPGTPVATDLMIALNKANLTIKSLQRRVLEKLSADGRIVGTVSGTPD